MDLKSVKNAKDFLMPTIRRITFHTGRIVIGPPETAAIFLWSGCEKEREAASNLTRVMIDQRGADLINRLCDYASVHSGALDLFHFYTNGDEFEKAFILRLRNAGQVFEMKSG
jgi:hypothetical protein